MKVPLLVLTILAFGITLSIAIPAWMRSDRIGDPPPPSASAGGAFSMTSPIRHAPDLASGSPFETVGEVTSELSGAVLQDRDGFIWFGTYGGGLFRYDGRKIRPFAPESGRLSGRNVTSIHEDEDGVLWIATLDGLDRYDKSTGRVSPAPTEDGESIGGLWTICSRGEDLYLGTHGKGVVRYRPSTGEVVRYLVSAGAADASDRDKVYRILPTANGHFWLGTFGGGVVLFDPASGEMLRTLGAGQGLPNEQVWSLCEDRRGRLWIGTQDGLVRWEPSNDAIRSYRHVHDDVASIGGRVVTSIREDEEGRLWVTSFNGPSALSRIDPETDAVSRFGERSGLAPRGARCVFEDRDGTFWVATMTGLARQGDAGFGFHHLPIGTGLLPILEDSDGGFWFGTMNGLLDFDRTTGRFAEVPVPPLDHSLISALAEDRQGRLWVATYGGDLHRFDRRSRRIEVSHVHLPADPSSIPTSNCIRRILPDRGDDDRLWLLTQGGGLASFEIGTGRATRHRFRAGDETSISSDVASYGALLQDPDGRLWVGTDDGLCRFDPERGIFRRVRAGALRSTSIQALHRDASGVLWVATARGLHRLLDEETEVFEAVGRDEGLVDEMILGILEDQGRLWLSTPSGLAEIDPGRGAPPRFYGEEEGLRTNGFLLTSSLRTRDGELWFGGPRGATHFRPREIRASAEAPPVALTALRRDGRDLELGRAPSRAREIHLSRDLNRFEFEVAALSFAQPTLNRYRYKLEGHDEDWFETREGGGRYSGLPGGEYLLRVQASRPGGPWTEDGVALKVVVEPSIWRAPWFIASVILVATLLLATGAYYFDRLSREVRQRREAERGRALAMARLEEATRVEALGRLAAGVSHDFNNLLMVVLGEVELLRLKIPGALEAELDPECRAIESAALQAADLTAQLWAYSSRRESTPKVRSLNSLIVDSRRLLQRAVGNEVAIECRLDPSDPLILVDASKITQVLLNLAVNARQAMTEGGRLAIATSTVRAARGPGGTERRYVRLSVSDDGGGIPAELTERIFDPFFTTKRQGEGTGLGLAIVKEVAEKHGGFVSVESAPEEGSTFHVHFPIVSGGSGDRVPEPEAGIPASRGGRLLLVEDESRNRALLDSALSAAGYEVVGVGNASEALVAWERNDHDFRVVVSDVVLPGMEGNELVDRLRADAPEIPVLFVTGFARDQARIDPPGSGPWRLREKPLSPDSLLDTLDDLLQIDEAADGA